MMDYVVEAVDSLKGQVQCPASKSYTIRAVLCALLADGESVIRSPLRSRDTRAAFDACEAFGASLRWEASDVFVEGVGGRPDTPSAAVDTLNSGTTIRIATAIASLCGGEVTLTGDESVRSRPMSPLLDALEQLGAKTSSIDGSPPVTVSGPLLGGSCEMPGDVSSQFVTAVLMAAPYAKKDVSLSLTNSLKSRPYVDLTFDILKHFKVEARNDGYQKFTVGCAQTYSPADYTVEGDYSSAAFVLCAAAATNSDVTVKNLFRSSLQADKKILEILSDMGAHVDVKDDSVRVTSDGILEGVTVDLSDSPDLVPVVAAMGCHAKGPTEIVNAEHARLKECDRISAMATELSKMGAEVRERRGGLTIQGGQLHGAEVRGWRDHRIIMALSVAALKADSATTIKGAQHVDVTFPGYDELMNSLGARISQK